MIESYIIFYLLKKINFISYTSSFLYFNTFFKYRYCSSNFVKLEKRSYILLMIINYLGFDMKIKAPQNRTLQLDVAEIPSLKKKIIIVDSKVQIGKIKNKIINGDFFKVSEFLPKHFVDLLFIDPPYNLTKSYNGKIFNKMSYDNYFDWVVSWTKKIKPLLKKEASIYVCGDWRTSSIIHKVFTDNDFHVLNRITIEREKGRGSKKFWKNNSEDIWFFSNSQKYYFNADAVKLKRRVLAPYRLNGEPKDWEESENGKFRLTYPSNIWTDITIPFWSMPENTPHPTQKPEKLLAKILLASSKEGDMIFDPFGGVGTTAVVAQKLGRNFVLSELDEEYCLYAAKRLVNAKLDKSIQGYKDGYFLDRNISNQ